MARTSTLAAALVSAALLSGCGFAVSEPAVVDPTSAAPTPTSAPTPIETSAAPAPTSTAADPTPTQPDPPPETSSGTAAAQLATLPVKGRAPMTGYSRERFGQAWLDADRNGCDTRNDVLGDYLTGIVLQPGTRDCVVTSGVLADPYTGTLIDFVRGDGTLVDVDHVVALGNAWVTGAFGWDVAKRAAFANDPLNLLPVDASANRQKGDGDAATWLPPSKGFRCAYVARQVSVKAKYGLWVTSPERDAVRRVLTACPDQQAVPDSGAPLQVDQRITDPGTPAGGSPSSPSTPNGDVYFESCDAARAAGAAPVRRGDPGYGSHLDGDDDGVSCE